MKITQTAENRRQMMLDDKISKVIPMLAIPMIISMMIDSFYNLADTYFVSWLGTNATAAVGVNNALMNFIRSIAMGFGVGAGSFISILLGGKRDKLASQTASTTLFTAIIFMAVFSFFGFIFRRPLMILLGAVDADILPYSMQYAGYILLSAPITGSVVCLSQILRSEGNARYSMFGTLSGCIVNIALDPLFIHVFKMEVAGAALATCISKAISLCVLIVPFVRHKTIVIVSPKNFTPSVFIYSKIARMGLPTFLRMGMMSITNVITNNIAATFNSSVLAAVSVSNKLMMMVASAVAGFGQGFQPVAGFCWGSKKYSRVREAFKFTLVVGTVSAIILGGLLYIAAPFLISAFTETDETIMTLGTYMVRMECLTLTMHVFVLVLNGLYQALAKPVGSTILGLSRKAICFLPCVVIFSHLYGAKGLAFSQAAADVLSAVIAVPLFIKINNQIKNLRDGADVDVLPTDNTALSAESE